MDLRDAANPKLLDWLRRSSSAAASDEADPLLIAPPPLQSPGGRPGPFGGEHRSGPSKRTCGITVAPVESEPIGSMLRGGYSHTRRLPVVRIGAGGGGGRRGAAGWRAAPRRRVARARCRAAYLILCYHHPLFVPFFLQVFDVVTDARLPIRTRP